MTRGQIVEARRTAAARRRRIILNNDGNEPVYLIKEPTAEEILAYRTAPFLGSQVDTVLYCTWSSGFGVFTHFTEVGQVFTCTEAMFRTNKMAELLKAGVDPLRVMNDFCRGHGIEFLWSMRMNDVHDGHPGTDYGPVMFGFNRLKREHPEYLISSPGDRPRYGSWSAVDYGADEIRELAFRYIDEVCRNYDVDGVELDFFRHPVFFRDPARGFPASQRELDLMSSLVARVREMMDDLGMRRGRPFLLAVRAPDSVPYCRAIGLDIERWLAEGLVDLLVPGGYIRMNPWEYSVALGHRYGVSVYPALDESRVIEEGSSDVTSGTFTNPRGRDESYRARAAAVHASGADGVYLYNFFNPTSPILRQLGEPETLRDTAKSYFASYRGVGRIAGDGYPHESYVNLPTLNPHHPTVVYAGLTERIEIGVYEHEPTTVELCLKAASAHAAGAVSVALNGSALVSSGTDQGWSVYRVEPSVLRRGRNAVEIANRSRAPLVVADLRIDVRAAG